MDININDIIVKKRDGEKLSKEEIEYFVEGFTVGRIPEYQAAALLMAIYFSKMDEEETFALTDAMRNSGDTIDLSSIRGIKVDKHSTGGVGDKTTLIVTPIVASLGIPVAKMSGRGLGFTGGTIDKLESIPGFKTEMEEEEFQKQIKDIGIGIIAQTAHIAPADKKMYALRDVTGTVENYSLVASSIMSKKLASGSDALVLDIKCGNGAFMKTPKEAEQLGHIMKNIGDAAGIRTVSVITDMNQPLGRAIGNSIEVIEAIETLKGRGPRDITTLSMSIATLMVYAGGKAETISEAKKMVKRTVRSGKALDKFRELIIRQGGNDKVIDNYHLFAKHSISETVYSPIEGYVEELDTKAIGHASKHTGAGRETLKEEIDMSAGVYLLKKIGDYVSTGDPVAVLYGNDASDMKQAVINVAKAYTISDDKPKKPLLVKKVIR